MHTSAGWQLERWHVMYSPVFPCISMGHAFQVLVAVLWPEPGMNRIVSSTFLSLQPAAQLCHMAADSRNFLSLVNQDLVRSEPIIHNPCSVLQRRIYSTGLTAERKHHKVEPKLTDLINPFPFAAACLLHGAADGGGGGPLV